MLRNMILSALLLGATSCTPYVRTTMIGTAHEPVTQPADILVYSVKVPECPFQEIALVSARRGDLMAPVSEDLLAALRTRAHRLGGQALIGLAERPGPDGEGPTLSATVIRFTETGCRPGANGA